ncbi:hypothetical protein BHM03_00015033 [Ensete ventricosum]|nr:hypothetical protein BHM03_00015033 [Ensete ventricosum]
MSVGSYAFVVFWATCRGSWRVSNLSLSFAPIGRVSFGVFLWRVHCWISALMRICWVRYRLLHRVPKLSLALLRMRQRRRAVVAWVLGLFLVLPRTRKLSKVRQRSRATMAWVPRLFLALPRTRQKHKTTEAWVPGLFLVLSRMWRRHRTIKAWVPRLFLVLSRMRRRHRTIEAWVPGLSLGTAKDDAEAQGWCNLSP